MTPSQRRRNAQNLRREIAPFEALAFVVLLIGIVIAAILYRYLS